MLNGISKYGIEFVKNLVGQFSITFVDLNLNKIFLIRDRLGQKPLFYSINDENLYFGSNLKVLKNFQITILLI